LKGGVDDFSARRSVVKSLLLLVKEISAQEEKRGIPRYIGFKKAIPLVKCEGVVSQDKTCKVQRSNLGRQR
jgi:hypothetical protein